MTLATAGAYWEANASATAGNVNGGYFNTGNTNMMTDLTTDANTANTNSPVVSSASYNFVAGDVGHWLYIKSGTNWIAGWYKISSVASNKATIDATIGAAIVSDSTQGFPTPRLRANTATGCATVGTPTGGTFTIDYSQGTTAILTATDYTSVGTSTTMTSVTGGFTKAMIGNGFHQTTTGTGGFGVAGWYEIVNVASGTSVTLDASPNNGTTSVACTGYVGGALSFNSTLDDDVMEVIGVSAGTGSARLFMKAGNYTLGESIAIGVTGATQNPNVIEGYTTLRGDGSIAGTRPAIALGTLFLTLGANWDIYFLEMTGTATTIFTAANNSKIVGCKFTNTSTNTNRVAVTTAADNFYFNNEIISYRGSAVSNGNTLCTYMGNYIHDSNIGIAISSTGQHQSIINNIFSGCVAQAINHSSGNTVRGVIFGNTIYGAENKLGVGINLHSGVTDLTVINNILAGLTSGVVHATTTQTVGYSDYNCYYNNTTDISGWEKGRNDSAANPTFTSVAQLTGTTATTSGSVLTQSGGDFSTVVAGRDFLYLVSGTGVTAGVYGITAATSTTVTLDIAPGTNATADKVWHITTGRNFAIGTPLKALGTPAVFPAGYTTAYTDIGAVQRQEAAGGLAANIIKGFTS